MGNHEAASNEEQVDAVLEKYVSKLVLQSKDQLAQQFKSALPSEEAAFEGFLGDCYFYLLFNVADLVMFIDSDDVNPEMFQVSLGDELRKRLTEAFFGEGRIYRVIGTRLSTRFSLWDELEPRQRQGFKSLYRKMIFITWSALIYWSGGYTSEKVAKAIFLED